jgi:TetR/AcrR family transcriptional regulator, tetracycline repressor protein
VARTREAQQKATPRERTLSEAVIVDATLALIRRKGAAALTMRDLADELGVSPMAAYYYVDNKDGLLRLVGDHVYAGVEVPPPDSGPWHERLKELVRAQRRAMRPYPGLSEALLYVDMEHKRRLEDAELDILLDAGFPAASAVPAFRTVLSWVSGNSAIETILRDPKKRRASAAWTNAQRLTFDREQMPEMHADDYFEYGLDVLIAGIRETLENRSRAR